MHGTLGPLVVTVEDDVAADHVHQVDVDEPGEAGRSARTFGGRLSAFCRHHHLQHTTGGCRCK